MADLRICFFGDSFVNGTGDPAMLGWTGRVCASQDRPLTCYNLGIRRDTSADVKARWQAEARRRLPPGVDARLVFSFGANDSVLEDGRPRVDPAASAANLRDILSIAKGLGPVLVVGPPPLGNSIPHANLVTLCAAFNTICRDLSVPYLPVLQQLTASDVWLKEAAAGDGAHPGSGGYQALADLVSGWPAWHGWFPEAGRKGLRPPSSPAA